LVETLDYGRPISSYAPCIIAHGRVLSGDLGEDRIVVTEIVENSKLDWPGPFGDPQTNTFALAEKPDTKLVPMREIHPAGQDELPYSFSQIITNLTIRPERTSLGNGDNWPITWADWNFPNIGYPTWLNAGKNYLGVFESSTPWGPWYTVKRIHGWGGDESRFQPRIPPQWISEDGKSFYLLYSCFPEGVWSKNSNDGEALRQNGLVIACSLTLRRTQAVEPGQDAVSEGDVINWARTMNACGSVAEGQIPRSGGSKVEKKPVWPEHGNAPRAL
jgi:hypothetical protein